MLIIPVILCGGSGTRLWPLSRTQLPKQFLPLLGERSLFQTTVNRTGSLTGSDKPIVIANQAHRFLVAEHLQHAGSEGDILLEPVSRNTAPAIAAAALQAQARSNGMGALMLVLPSDHLIHDEIGFAKSVEAARPHAEEGSLVTFGIRPTSPETGYGYIELGVAVGNVHAIHRFVEKPNLAKATEYCTSGKHLWNSGMFLLRSDTYLDALQQHAPEILSAAESAFENAVRDLDFIRLDMQTFEKSPSDSIDYAVMEKTEKGIVVPLDADWNDIGSWDALAATREPNADGNVVDGDVIAIDTRNCYLHAERQLLATVGITNLVIAATPDAILVADKSKAQRVKDIAAQLAREGRQEADFHSTVHRPWGSFEGIDRGPRYQVKRIHVKPGASLSLQMHHHRAEHWIVVKGTALVRCGDESRIISENESTFIPLGTLHLLENPGKIELELIEVQSGSYLGEDDIVRFGDHYGRS